METKTSSTPSLYVVSSKSETCTCMAGPHTTQTSFDLLAAEPSGRHE